MLPELDKAFNLAYKKISNSNQVLPPDIMLRLYAYYKQAEKGDNFSLNTNKDVRNAFKLNAWLQLQGMSEDEAKQEYINLVNTILK